MGVLQAAIAAKDASIYLAAVPTNIKNNALQTIAHELKNNTEAIIRANAVDIQRSTEENLPSPLLKRLRFDETKINEVIAGIESLINLPDPVGNTLLSTELDVALTLYKVSCPIGVIGVIFESRPDALVQISTLCLKSGNAVLLKGGSEAKETNKILASIIYNAGVRAGIPQNWLSLLETREDVTAMLKMDDYIDLIIPRGSNAFVKYIMDNSRIPVLGHADGICHCYVDKDADIDMAVKVVTDAKVQYVAVCNATETLLVHRAIANKFLPLIEIELKKYNVELVGCPETQKIINVNPATEDDWKTEYLDYKLSIKVVDDVDDAISHINKYGSKHTDSIITGNRDTAKKFLDLVDSGNVFWNCSTRFSDGFRYGFGAEVGISTSKIHARGPVGLDGLVIYKYKLIGNGHIVDDFAKGKRKFTHKKLNTQCPL
ncbi:MAG: glutamate-5-semialdehyde dehydrogenase [Spirochaetes bacterium]|nr:glutamate-5-semialdehyde dehydrogenase [Spirochaetota bacterium]